MQFRDVRAETKKSIELVCLFLSLAAIFFQIWILSSSWEAFFQSQTQRLLPGAIFSFIAFAICMLTAWTTGMNLMKGTDEGRTRTYHKHNTFKDD